MTSAPCTRVETDHGPGRLHTFAASVPRAIVLLSHGAGKGVDSRDLAALCTALPAQGFTVLAFDQPWLVAGRRVASPPASLDVGLRAAATFPGAVPDGVPLVVGGRSAGARSACRVASELGARGVLALSFPLHPPGKPEKSRVAELRAAGAPTLVIQGERDTMGRPDEFPTDLPGLDLAVVPEADHGLKVPKRAVLSEEESMALVVEIALEWLVREIVG